MSFGHGATVGRPVRLWADWCVSCRLDELSSTLQARLDTHLKHTQGSQSSFRLKLQLRLEEVAGRARRQLGSFRSDRKASSGGAAEGWRPDDTFWLPGSSVKEETLRLRR